MNNYKVFIPCAGIGARLGEFTENVNKAVENMNSSLANHSDLVSANTKIQDALIELSDAIKANDKNLMVNLSIQVSQLEHLPI